MNTHHLTLTFFTEADEALATLESVLATARRGNVAITRFQMEPARHDQELWLDASASEPELLDLFVARLSNIIGLHDCRVAEKTSRSQMRA